MNELLTEKEVQYLKEHFRLGKTKQESDLSIHISKLLNEDTLRIYISKIKNRINASNTSVAASMFVKRYSFLAVLSLFSMSAFNKAIDVSMENVFLDSYEQDELWMPRFRFKTLHAMEASSENRNEWRDRLLQNLFAENVNTLLTALSKETKISKYILWENIAVYIFWLYETMLEDSELDHKIIKDDAEYVIVKANGHLFGNYSSNPIKRYFHAKKFVPEMGKEIRVRSTCCLSYLSEKGNRCNTCPFQCNTAKSH